MIRVRHIDGRVAVAPPGAVVEITDDRGDLAMVIQTTHEGIRCATPGDPVFNAHSRTFRLRPSNVVVHEPVPRTRRQ